MKIKQLRILVLGVFCLFYLLACDVGSADSILPVETLDAKELIINSENYPADWQAFSCESVLCDSKDGSTYEQSFLPMAHEPGQFFQEVYRFSSISDAREKFLVYQNGAFNKESFDPKGTEFSIPSEFPYISLVADQYYFACARQFGLVCQMIARYKNYFIFMYFDMDDGRGYGLTFQEVEKILEGLDEQVAHLLYQ